MLSILFEDAHCIALDKPADLLITGPGETLERRVRDHLAPDVGQLAPGPDTRNDARFVDNEGAVVGALAHPRVLKPVATPLPAATFCCVASQRSDNVSGWKKRASYFEVVQRGWRNISILQR